MTKKLRLAALLGAIAAVPAIAVPASAKNLNVVASFSIIADFAKNVGGDRIELTTLVGPDGDAHVYEPKPADAAAMAAADVVLVNGLQFEGFLQRLAETSATKAAIVELAKGVETIKMEEEAHEHGHAEAAAEEEEHEPAAEEGHNEAHEVAEEEGNHHHGGVDPHAFQSIPNAEIYVKNIADAFCAADAAGCGTYKANAESYTAKLQALDGEVRASVASIPQGKRVVITSHDAFGYFAHEYGIAFLAPEGVSTESEASAADVAALIRQIKEDKASAIFVENITDPRLVEQIATETDLKVGGTLFSDALSDESGSPATYIDMMRHNIQTIRGAIIGS
jgi:zinc/manganese transport system substrate-binding protein